LARRPIRAGPQVFENLRRCLAAAGPSFGEVAKLTFYITDMAHLPAVRAMSSSTPPTDGTPAARTNGR